MDIKNFVQNIKDFCAKKNVKPTVACRESGVGQSFINNMEARGSIPSIEKVQMLAQYLDVTTSELLGETQPGDSIDRNLPYPDRVLLDRYHAADTHTQEIVDEILALSMKKKKTSSTAG